MAFDSQTQDDELKNSFRVFFVNGNYRTLLDTILNRKANAFLFKITRSEEQSRIRLKKTAVSDRKANAFLFKITRSDEQSRIRLKKTAVSDSIFMSPDTSGRVVFVESIRTKNVSRT